MAISGMFSWVSVFFHALLFLAVFSAQVVFASVTDGTIDSTNKYAKGLDSNVGSINFGLSAGNVHVTDSALTGYAWGENVGWINLSPAYGGISNNNEGTLSGYAWGELAGWVNFSPTNGGVTINSGGDFAGYAWSQNFGWIVFNCATNSSCSTESFKVSTDWRPRSARTDCNNAGDDDSDGQTDYPNDSDCDSITDDSESPVNGSSGGSSPSSGGSTGTVTDVQTEDAGTPPTPAVEDNPITPVPPTPPPVYPPLPPPVDTETGEPPVNDEIAVSDTGGEAVAGGGGGGFAEDTLGFSNVTQLLRTALEQVKESLVFVTESTHAVREEVRQVVESPTGTITTKVATVSGIAVNAGLALSTLFLSPLSISEIVLIPLRLWSLLLAAFGLKRKNRPWGTVYDSVTKQPLDPAYVTLFDEFDNEVKSSITDLDGRYGFLLAAGKYHIRSGKTHYRFPSTKLAGRASDALYRDLYFGDDIDVKGEGDVVFRNIPMDQEGFDWNEFQKEKRKLTRFFSRHDVWVVRISSTFFTFGFILAAIALSVSPTTYNILTVLLYGALILLRRCGFKPKALGLLEEKQNGNPLSFAVVRVLSPNGYQIARTICDAHGRYYCLVPPGEYQLQVEKKIDSENYLPVYLSPVINVKNGIVNRRLVV